MVDSSSIPASYIHPLHNCQFSKFTTKLLELCCICLVHNSKIVYLGQVNLTSFMQKLVRNIKWNVINPGSKTSSKCLKMSLQYNRSNPRQFVTQCIKSYFVKLIMSDLKHFCFLLTCLCYKNFVELKDFFGSSNSFFLLN